MDDSDGAADLKRIKPEPAVKTEPVQAEVGDDLALKETIQLNSGKSSQELERQLERTAQIKEANRDQHFRDSFEKLSISAMRLMFLALSIIGFVWLLNILLPESCSRFWGVPFLCRWLTSDQTTILQDILTGGLIGGLIADHFRKRISR